MTMDTMSPNDVGQTGQTEMMSKINLLVQQNQLLLERTNAMEQQMKEKDELLSKMANYLLPEKDTPKENWYWVKNGDPEKYEKPEGHWDAARPEKISHSDTAILEKTEESISQW